MSPRFRRIVPFVLVAGLVAASGASAYADGATKDGKPRLSAKERAVKAARASAAKRVRLLQASEGNLVANPSFETSLTGWKTYASSATRVSGGVNGSYSARVTASRNGTYSIYPSPRPVRDAVAGEQYSAGAWVRGKSGGATVCLQIREWASSPVASVERCQTLTTSWSQFPALAYTARGTGTEIEVYVYGRQGRKKQSYDVDLVWLTKQAAPVATSAPEVTGDAEVGGTLSTSDGTWEGSPTSFRYAWLRCDAAGASCAAIAGAEARTYAVVSADAGSTLRSRVTAVSAAGSTSAESAATPVVAVPAPTYYVAPHGSDANPGTLAAPWATLRKALPSLSPGDVLVVRGGTYSERLGGSTPVSIRPATADAPIVVRAYPGERPVVEGLLWLRDPSHWTLDGINVTWRSDGAANEHMVKFTNGVGWRFTNGEVWGARSYAAILVAGTVTGQPAGWRIDHSCIHDTQPTNNINQDHNIYANTGLSAGTGVIERNVLFNATNGENVKVAGPSSSDGSANVVIRYNTMFNAAQPILVGGQTQNTWIYRNLIEEGIRGYLLRGYKLVGTGNKAHDNFGYGADRFLWNDSNSSAGIADEGGNVFPRSPLLTETGSCAGFVPGDSVATAYGHLAP